MRNKFIAALTALLLLVAGLFTAQAAQAETNEPGTSPDNPIILGDPDEAPEGAETDGPYANQCATEQTWELTGTYEVARYSREVPPVQEVSHTEYRWKVYNRTYDPGQEEVSHEVYSYVKDVPDFDTKFQYQKQTQTSMRHGDGAWQVVSAWSWWSPASTQWSFDDVEVLESGNHADWKEWHWTGILQGHWDYYDRDYRYVKNGVTEEVQVGTHQEFSGEVTDPMGAPWVILDGYPKTVIDQAYVAPSFTGWAFAGYTDWQTSPEAPADPDGEAGEDNPLNLVQLGSRLSKVVVTTEARPAYTEYFVLGGEPSRDADDATWVTEDQAPGEGWEKFDSEVRQGETTYYFWTDGVECPEPYTEERTTSSATTTCEATVTITQDWTRDWTLGEDLELHPGEWIADGDPVSTSAAPTAAEIEAAGLVCTTPPPATPVVLQPSFTG